MAFLIELSFLECCLYPTKAEQTSHNEEEWFTASESRLQRRNPGLYLHQGCSHRRSLGELERGQCFIPGRGGCRLFTGADTQRLSLVPHTQASGNRDRLSEDPVLVLPRNVLQLLPSFRHRRRRIQSLLPAQGNGPAERLNCNCVSGSRRWDGRSVGSGYAGGGLWRNAYPSGERGSAGSAVCLDWSRFHRSEPRAVLSPDLQPASPVV